MKKLLFISILIVTFSVSSALADGDMPAGSKTCQGSACFADGQMPTGSKTCQGSSCFADGDMGAGTKTCQGSSCFADGETENVDFISMIYKKLFALIK
jgi:hypothetical protein